jgi:hypothetical protein
MCVDAAYPTSRPVITSGPSSASGSYLQSHGKVRRTRFLTRWRSWRLRALVFSIAHRRSRLVCHAAFFLDVW